MSIETMSVEQVAQLLLCTPEKVEELARTGELPGMKFGRGWVFLRSTLLAHLERQSVAQQEERRAKRRPSAATPISRPRRQTPPALA